MKENIVKVWMHIHCIDFELLFYNLPKRRLRSTSGDAEKV